MAREHSAVRSPFFGFPARADPSAAGITCGRVFLHTNIILYANDRRDPENASRATECVAAAKPLRAWDNQGFGGIEAAVAKLHRTGKRSMRDLLGRWEAWRSLVHAIIRRRSNSRGVTNRVLGREHHRHRGHAKCGVLYLEDLNAGQLYAERPGKKRAEVGHESPRKVGGRKRRLPYALRWFVAAKRCVERTFAASFAVPGRMG